MAGEAIARCRPADQLAVFAFDAPARPLLGFDESATLDPARRQAVAQARVERLAPPGRRRNLGQALIDAVAAIEDVADASEKSGRMPRRIVLISDLQQGSRLDALGEFEWPSDVELDLKTVADDALQRRPAAARRAGRGRAAAGRRRERRVRVFNDPDSRREKFELHWVDERGKRDGKPIDVYVPPGESRVVRVPRPTGLAPAPRRFASRETRTTFDNTLYFADERQEEATVLYVGDDAPDDPAGLLYYLERVFVDTPAAERHGRRRSSPTAPLALEPERIVPLVVLTAETTAENARRLGEVRRRRRDRALRGRPARAGPRRSPPWRTPAPWTSRKPAVAARRDAGRDRLRPSALRPVRRRRSSTTSPRSISGNIGASTPMPLGDARVLARFENGDPAVIEKPIGKGRLVVLASGWSPPTASSRGRRSSSR